MTNVFHLFPQSPAVPPAAAEPQDRSEAGPAAPAATPFNPASRRENPAAGLAETPPPGSPRRERRVFERRIAKRLAFDRLRRILIAAGAVCDVNAPDTRLIALASNLLESMPRPALEVLAELEESKRRVAALEAALARQVRERQP